MWVRPRRASISRAAFFVAAAGVVDEGDNRPRGCGGGLHAEAADKRGQGEEMGAQMVT